MLSTIGFATKNICKRLSTVFFIPESQYSCEAKTEYGTRKSKLGVLAYSQSDLSLPGVLSQTINFVTQVFIYFFCETDDFLVPYSVLDSQLY